MGRYLLLWLLGVPIPILLLIAVFGGLHYTRNYATDSRRARGHLKTATCDGVAGSAARRGVQAQ